MPSDPQAPAVTAPMQPVALRLSRARGFDLQAHSRATNGLPAVNAARPGPLGNPFVVGEDGDRAECVRLHRMLLLGGLVCLSCKASLLNQERSRHLTIAALSSLRGCNIACWCSLPQPNAPDVCHRATLLEWAND